MKHRLPAIVLAALVQLAWAAAPLAAQPAIAVVGGPKIVWNADQTSVYGVEVRVTNTGSAPLAILGTVPAPMSGIADTPTVAPGDTIALQTRVFVGNVATRATMMTIESNDPAHRFTHVQIDSLFLEPILITVVDRGQPVYVDRDVVCTVRLENRTRLPVTVQPPADEQPCCRCRGVMSVDMRMPVTLYPNEGIMIDVHFVPGAVGNSMCVLRFPIEGQEMPQVTTTLSYSAELPPRK